LDKHGQNKNGGDTGIAGFSAETAIGLKFPECLADDAVIREPVSGRNSLYQGK
jgi:hypothetical protein